ncbi:dihydrofolate reductase family protein [Aggregatilinea lenta]|uniref:dihydrofolate reductase family protein n=1 Tax=Aggregatilinea lenta TaxID=913108 RepID=UPI000E5B998F|nr:dihydrofolate reductase family protein [Aggregatilinea lenta]
MRNINAALFITLDGVVEAPGGESTLPPERRAWSMPYTTDEVGQVIGDAMANSDAMLLGRITYQDFAAYWPNAPEDDPFGQFMNNQPKYVVSTTLDNAEWKNSHLITDNVVAELTKLKQQPGKDITIVGSGTLTRSLIEADLVDELRLMLCPVVLGVGKRLFEDAHSMKSMKVLEVRSFDSGMIYLRLQPEKQA